MFLCAQIPLIKKKMKEIGIIHFEKPASLILWEGFKTTLRIRVSVIKQEALLSKADYSSELIRAQWPVVTELGTFVHTNFNRPCLDLNLWSHGSFAPLLLNNVKFDQCTCICMFIKISLKHNYEK